MNWPEFENEMRNQVAAHETPIDSDALWEKIREKRRKRAFIWFWSAGFVVVCGVLCWHYAGNKQQLHNEHSFENAPVRNVEPVAALQQKSASSVPEKIPGDFNPAPINSTSATTYDQKSSRFAEQLKTKSQAKKPVHLPIPQKNPTQIQTPQPVSERKGGFTSAGLVDVSTPFLQDSLETLPLPLAVKTDTLAIYAEQALPWLPVSLYPLTIPEKALIYPEIQPIFTTIPLEKSKKVHGYRPGIGFVGGYYRWNSVGTAIPALDSMSRRLETIQGTFQFSLPISAKWTFLTGISYAKTTSLLTWVRTWEAWQPRIRNGYYGNGTVISNSDSALYNIRREIRHYNYWQQIGVPLGLQYRFPLGKGYLAPMASVQFNYLLPAKGVANNADYNLDPAVFRAAYQRKWLLQAQIGIEFGWQLGKNWTVVVGPHAQFDCTPRTTKNAASSERFLQYGIQLGVRRSF